MSLKIRLLLIIVIFAVFLPNAYCLDKINRLGVGVNNEFQSNFPAISFKMQKNRSFSYGGLFGMSTNSTSGGQAIGLKIYRNLFDEPQLNFYMAGMGAFLNNKMQSTSYSGFQFDFTFGSEFHFTGLNSLGLSFEFGVSAYKQKEFIFQTLGNHFIVSGIHFYL